MRELKPQTLSTDAFAEYGEVVDLANAKTQSINQGLTTRFHDLATVDTDTQNGRTLINVFRSNPINLPHRVEIMERHPLGSQCFFPLAKTPYLVLVGKGEIDIDPDSLRLFYCDGTLGVNYFRNTWHHYQMVLGESADFLVIDRGGPGNNLEEQSVAEADLVIKPVN